jgi:hypothetical protein
MSSNPLGDVFYDDDGLSLTNSEPTARIETFSGTSSQPYISDMGSPRPTQYDAPSEPNAPVQQNEQDDRYVQPERTTRPKQSAPTPVTASHEPQLAPSSGSGLRRKTFGSAAYKPAVVVMKMPSGQAKLSKARAAARLAAISSSAPFVATKQQAPKMPRVATALENLSERAMSDTSRHAGDHAADKEASKPRPSTAPAAKAEVPKRSAKPRVTAQEIPAVKVAEATAAELTSHQGEQEPRARRGKDKVRVSFADKMRAQRGMRSSKASR